MKIRCNMKRLVFFLAFQILLSSCAINYGKESGRSEERSTEKGGVKVSCKPQREIFVKGKCVKRRKYM